MIREQLIYYSLKYQGEYKKILDAIKSQESFCWVNEKNCFTILDDVYPKEFYNLAYPPFVIYYKGNLELLKGKKVAVVGSRKVCDYAHRATELLIDKLNDNDCTIVSGLAVGIDGIAQRRAKKTIGILGSGIDCIYPKRNEELIKTCFDKQLVLSEYPKMVPPLKHHFPIRNRLIASLSSEVYVMQAEIKSGTMTTVKHALDLNKNIYALPYRIFDTEGEGCNLLIEEGAELISFYLN